LKDGHYRFTVSGAATRFVGTKGETLASACNTPNGLIGRDDMAWIRKETLDGIPELPRRVDFDDWAKDWGMVNLLSNGKKDSKPLLPAGFYKTTKGGRLCGLEVKPSVKGIDQAVWLEKPTVRVRGQTQAI
jgi:hypothetical protein